MKKLRRVTEAEVISEFLKGEFFQKEYDFDRDLFSEIVHQPDLTNETENALRRALLYRRRAKMWWELPDERQWWEISLEEKDIDRLSVFPRAHWVKLSRGKFQARHVAEQVRRRLDLLPQDPFSAKMSGIISRVQKGAALGIIILLGVDESSRVTVLEGNHRLIASLLAAGKELPTRFVVGFSPKMKTCCWYKTNLRTLVRCLKNRIQHSWDRDADVAGLLDQIAQARTGAGFAEVPGSVKSKIISH